MAEGDCIYLNGIGISGYRSFPCNAPQRLYPLSKINLVAGANNSGKSNILGFVQKFIPKSKRDAPDVFEQLDRPHADEQFLPRLDVAINFTEFCNRLSTVGGDRQTRQALEDSYRALTGFDDLDHPFWISLQRADGAPRFDLGGTRTRLSNQTFSTNQNISLNYVIRKLLGGRGSTDTAFDQLLGEIAKEVPSALPRVVTIPAFRRIQPGDEEETATGKGLISRIAKLESPIAGHDSDREKFLAIQKFVQVVLDEPDVTIAAYYGFGEPLCYEYVSRCAGGD